MTDPDVASAEPRWLSAAEQAAWRAYLDMTTLLSATLSRELQADDGISLADFAVLASLSEQEQGALRAGDLGRTLGWEKSRLSHQLSRMQRRGLIERRGCAEDRRSAVVVLTDDGRSAITRAAPRHVDAVRRHLFDHLDAADVQALQRVAGGVVDRIRPTCAQVCSDGSDPGDDARDVPAAGDLPDPDDGGLCGSD